MKVQRKIAGLAAAVMMTAAMSTGAVWAAEDTVSVSVSEETAAAGSTFTVEVSLDNIPSAGVGVVDLAIEFDASLVTISDVAEGSLCGTGAADAENSLVSSLGDTVFDWYQNGDNQIAVLWVTGLTDSSYWLKDGGCFLTITGTVNSDAAEGSVAAFNVVPIDRETTTGSGVANGSVVVGYLDASGSKVSYATEISNGSVTVGSSGSDTSSLYGDADCDGAVKMADIVLMTRVMNDADTLTEQGRINANVILQDDPDVTASDVSKILTYISGQISYSDLIPVS